MPAAMLIVMPTVIAAPRRPPCRDSSRAPRARARLTRARLTWGRLTWGRLPRGRLIRAPLASGPAREPGPAPKAPT